ncbi:MAG: hypothetical protein ACRDUV_22990 [Pseudonocardiaceae bacterium]
MLWTELADHPAVTHAVYLVALWPRPGQSLLDLFGGEVPAIFVVRPDGAVTVSEDVELVRQTLCAGLDPDASTARSSRCRKRWRRSSPPAG